MYKGYVLAGGYEIIDILGQGGMATVYRGRVQQSGREVAIKVINYAFATDANYIQRFNREKEVTAQLSHPNILPLLAAGLDELGSYLVIPLLKGGTLNERMRAAKELISFREVGLLAQQVGSALHYAHEQGIIHRDIKFSNIMFDESGNPYVMDFGIAKVVDGTQLTATGAAGIGSSSFMPPEQWSGSDVTPKVDQYALAVVLYNLVTGRAPFEGKTSQQLMYQHLEVVPPRADTLRADIPFGMVDALERALSKEADARFTTMAAFAEDMYQASLSAPEDDVQYFTAPIEQKSSRPIPTAPSTNMPVQPSIEPVMQPAVASNPTGDFVQQQGNSGWAAPVTVVLMMLVAIGIGYVVFNNPLATPDDATPEQNTMSTTIAASDLTTAANATQVVVAPTAIIPETPVRPLANIYQVGFDNQDDISSWDYNDEAWSLTQFDGRAVFEGVDGLDEAIVVRSADGNDFWQSSRVDDLFISMRFYLERDSVGLRVIFNHSQRGYQAVELAQGGITIKRNAEQPNIEDRNTERIIGIRQDLNLPIGEWHEVKIWATPEIIYVFLNDDLVLAEIDQFANVSGAVLGGDVLLQTLSPPASAYIDAFVIQEVEPFSTHFENANQLPDNWDYIENRGALRSDDGDYYLYLDHDTRVAARLEQSSDDIEFICRLLNLEGGYEVSFMGENDSEVILDFRLGNVNIIFANADGTRRNLSNGRNFYGYNSWHLVMVTIQGDDILVARDGNRRQNRALLPSGLDVGSVTFTTFENDDLQIDDCMLRRLPPER